MWKPKKKLPIFGYQGLYASVNDIFLDISGDTLTKPTSDTTWSSIPLLMLVVMKSREYSLLKQQQYKIRSPSAESN